MARRSLLCIAPYQLYPPNHGGSVVIWNKLEALSAHYNVHVLCPENFQEEKNEEKVRMEFGKVFKSFRFFRHEKPRFQGRLGRIFNYYGNRLFSGKPGLLGALANSGLAGQVERYVAEEKIDFLLLEHGYMVLTIESLRMNPRSRAAEIPWIVVEHNVESAVIGDEAKFKVLSLPRRLALWREARKMASTERQMYRIADGVLYLSAQDRQSCEARGLSGKSATVTTIIKPVTTHKTNFSETGRVVFFGTLEYFPNFEGLIWFARKVWPLIQKVVPKAQLVVPGSFSSKLGRSLEGIPGLELPGPLPHQQLDALITNCDVFISPIRLGSGIKIKNLVAMNLAMPIVACEKSFEGILVETGRDLFLADHPADFAQAVLGVLRSEDLRKSLSKNVSERYAGIYPPEQAIQTWISGIERFMVAGARREIQGDSFSHG